jgi:hypothetical protein
MARRSRKWEPPKQTEPDWHGFGKILAIGRLRYMGLLPMPPELLAQNKEADLPTEQVTAQTNIDKEPLQNKP